MLFHVQIGPPVENISLVVLELLLDVGAELALLCLSHKLLVQRQGVVDRRHILEVDGVRYLEALHSIVVPPLLEVHFEGPPTPVAEVSADLALVLNAEAVEFVQPVGNGLPIPSQGQVFRVVYRSVSLLAFGGLFLDFINVLVSSCLLLSHQVHRVVNSVRKFLPQLHHLELFESQLFLSLQVLGLEFFLGLLLQQLVLLQDSGIIHVHFLLVFQVFQVVLSRQMVNVGPVPDVQLLAVSTVLPLRLIDAIVLLLPPSQLIF